MTNVINIRNFVDVSTSVVQTSANVARDWGAALFVQKGTNGQTTALTQYDDLEAVVNGAGSNSEAAKFATQFYGTTYNGIAPTSSFWVAIIGAEDVDEFNTNFTALMASEDYYLIGVDTNFTTDAKKSAAAIVQATQANATHKLFLDDASAEAANLDLEHDTASISAYCKNNGYTATFAIWVNPTNTVKYYSAAAASFFSTRQFNTTDRKMASIAHKAAQGISPVDLTDTNVTVSPSQAFANLDEKHTNLYANIKIVGLPAWERGNVGSGDDLSDYISADYLNYVVTMSVFNLLQTTPRVPMNNDGAVMLAGAIETGFVRLSNAGVIAGGVSLDGESFPQTGYKISIPIPTGIAKANGLWEDIDCRALLAGSAKKVVIGNTLKK